MKLPRRQFLHLAAGAAALPALPRIVRAQTYPARPITMIVPFAAGGPNDRIARIMAERMQVLLGQPVMIENIDGAAGSIGTGRAARAAPDGYTICIGYWGSHVANAAIYPLDYDVAKDFEPISLLVESPLLIAAGKATPASDLREFVNWLRANPDKASAAVPGSASHVTSVFFQRQTGTRFRLVPYRGAGPRHPGPGARADRYGATRCRSAAAACAFGRVQSLRRFRQASSCCSAGHSDCSGGGISQSGCNCLVRLLCAAGTPHDIIAKLNAAAVEALADPNVRSRLAELALDIFPREQQTPAALAALQRAEIEKWWPIIKAANIKPE